jgi:PAS domain S-box-containing protein
MAGGLAVIPDRGQPWPAGASRWPGSYHGSGGQVDERSNVSRRARSSPGVLSPADVDHERTLELLSHQTRILELLASGTPLKETLDEVARALEQLMPGGRCSILLIDEGGILRHGAAPSLPEVYIQAIDGQSIGPNKGSCGTAAYLGKPVLVSDVSVDERWADYKQFILPHGLRACWSTPIFSASGAVLGTFAVYHAEPHSPTPAETRLIERFTYHAAVAIEHDKLFGELAESEERFRRSFEDNAVGMALVALNGRYLKVNGALCQMVGRTERELLAGGWRGITHPDDISRSVDSLDRLLEDGASSTQIEKRYLRPDDTEVWVTVTATLVRAFDGSPLYYCANVLDITERKQVEELLRAQEKAEVARAAAESASQAKSEFLSRMSHELRTPLSSVLMFAEALRNGALPGEDRGEALDSISKAGTHIRDLVDDVLDLAKIEAGVVTLEMRPVCVEGAVREAAHLLGPLAEQRGVKLEEYAGDPEVAVVADPVRLKQVLLNLMANAIRYNQEGGSVSVTLTNGRRSAIHITDTGPGIPPEHQHLLFRPFERLGTQDAEGTGLGLAVCHRLVHAMGGTIRVDSSPGVGSTFSIELAPARGN